MRTFHHPVTTLYTARGLRKYIAPDERARFLAVAAQWPRAEIATLCLVLAHTGCRLSEALGLTTGAIGLHSGFIAIRSLKKRSSDVVVREVPVPKALIVRLIRVHELDGREPVRPLWTWSRSRAWRLVKTVLAEAGIQAGPHATAKGLRHGFGLHAVRCGIPLNLIQRWLGHASMTTTAIYLQAMGPEEHALASRMWDAADRPDIA